MGAVYFGRHLEQHGFTNLTLLRDQYVRDFIASTPIRLSHGKYPMHVSRVVRAAPHVLRYLRQIGVAPPATIPVQRPFEPLLNEWLLFLRHHRGLTEGSLDLYRRQITRFLETLGNNATPQGLKTINTEQIRSYVRNRASSYGRSQRKALVSTLRLFLGFAWDRGYLEKDLRVAVERIPVFKHEQLPRGPSWENALRLLKVPDRRTVQGRRDYAILLILLSYGVRAIQIVNLKMEDIDWRGMKIHFRATKGGRSVEVPLIRPVGDAILDYLQKGRPLISAYRNLFLTLYVPVKSLEPGSIYNIVYHAFQSARVPSPHRGSHALRHAWATRMLWAGQSLKVIADLLGHRQIETTRIYAKVDLARLQEVALPWPSNEVTV
jgi:site-specific recombinase XerD